MANFSFRLTVTFTDATSVQCSFDTTTFANEQQARTHAINIIQAAMTARGKYLPSGKTLSDVQTVQAVRL